MVGNVNEQQWDERYAAAERVWSGQPNAGLVAEVERLKPGRVLDIGCGEGADAVWLAQQGWEVTGLDVSGVALERARAWAAENDVDVTWVHSGLLEADLPPASFDLVIAFYPDLPATPHHEAERAMLAAVAPRGTFLFAHHQVQDLDASLERGYDPRERVSAESVRATLNPSWVIDVHEVRERTVAAGAGAHHTHDAVLRARRVMCAKRGL